MYYNRGGISVDQNFARFSSKSYAINKINTVDVQVNKPYSEGLSIFFGIIAVISLVMVFQGSPGAALFALVFGGLTIWAYKRSKILEYRLFLMTSSSSAQAFTTRDADEIDELRDAIETAMTAIHDREYRVHHEHSLRRSPTDDGDDDTSPPRTIRQRLLR